MSISYRLTLRPLCPLWWLAIMAVFVLMNCWGGLQQARVLARVAAAPRRSGLAYPHCKTPPSAGNFWICGRCRAAFDMFATRRVCPNCGTIFNDTRCMECGEPSPLRSFGRRFEFLKVLYL